MELEWQMLTTAGATTIQAAWRGHAARTLYRTEKEQKTAAVLPIQTAFRRHSAAHQYQAQKEAALL
eukprot:COSAG02_NODE_22432_length_753_cov_0.698777_2_plen_65_part_01